MITIAISVRQDVARVALLEGDRLIEYAIWHFEQPGDIGDIYTGRLIARVPAMAGSFIDLGISTGFLPDSAGGSGLTEGNYLAVQITRCAQSGKGPRLSAIEHEFAHKPGLIRQSLGPLHDFATRFPMAAIYVDSYSFIVSLSDRCRQLNALPLAAAISYKTVAVDPVLDDEIAALLEPSFQLGGGACMHVTPTAALTAIDIDAGAESSDRNQKSRAQLNLNTTLIPEIARQILLRNLSGAILIDFAGMKSSARPKLLPALNLAFKTDPLNPKCLGFSHLGFAEITRPRIRPALHEYLQ